ncbi:hypothetical protein ACJJTC_008527 [Scirpophaga incertulas]
MNLKQPCWDATDIEGEVALAVYELTLETQTKVICNGDHNRITSKGLFRCGRMPVAACFTVSRSMQRYARPRRPRCAAPPPALATGIIYKFMQTGGRRILHDSVVCES